VHLQVNSARDSARCFLLPPKLYILTSTVSKVTQFAANKILHSKCDFHFKRYSFDPFNFFQIFLNFSGYGLHYFTLNTLKYDEMTPSGEDKGRRMWGMHPPHKPSSFT